MGRKEQYEERINGSPFFAMDPEKDPSGYEREKNRLIEMIYLYKTEESGKYAEYAVEIVEVLSDCLKYYRPQDGVFLHYYNAAFRKRIRIAEAEEKLSEQSSGIHFSRTEKAASRAVLKYLETHPEVDPDRMLQVLDSCTRELGMTHEELKTAVEIYKHSVSRSGDAPVSAEDASLTLFDTLKDRGEFTETVLSRESIREFLEHCEQAYLESREGTRRLLAIKLTSLLVHWDQEGEYAEEIRRRVFFDKETRDRVILQGSEIRNKEISRLLGKSEANLTQIWKRFLERLER
ncbi:MAG: hypothetical protein IJ106_05455 [Parasporobacterium sp.]|nr:hypothetical protein [Parasporobacterium sp.]